jgi:hypothetical protein
MSRLLQSMAAHRALIVLTFEIFWILVAVLDSASATAPAGPMQFIYANF